MDQDLELLKAIAANDTKKFKEIKFI